MSSQDEASSVVSSSHDRSDDDWDGSDADAGAAAKKKKKEVVVAPATSGRRQLARRPVKPRTTNTFGNYSSSSDSSSSSSDSYDDVKNSNTNAHSNGKDEESSAASFDSPPQKRQQTKKKIQRNNTTQPPKQKSSAIAKENNNKSKSSIAKKSKKKVESESESEEEEEWNDDEDQQQSESSESDSDSDFGAPPPSSSNKRRGGNKTKKSPASLARKKSSTSTRTPRSKRTTRQKMNMSYDDESEKNSDNEEIQYHTTPTGTRRPSRSCSQRTNKRMSQVVKQDMKSERDALGEVLEDDDKELLENSSSEKSDDDDDDDDNEKGDADDKRLQKRLRNNRVSNGRAKVVTRGTNKYDDDDDYDENANSSNDDDDSDGDDDDDDDDFEIDSDDMAVSKRRSNRTQQNRGRGGKKKPNYTEIDSDIGTADENTTDEETGPSLLTSPVNAKKKSSGSYGSPAMRKRARAGRGGRTPLDMREDDGSSSSNEDEDDEQQQSSKKRKRQTPASTRKRRPYMDSSDSDSDEQDSATPHTGLRTTHNCCPSLIDDITMMNLPKNKPHVCYIAPDGKSRHCFTLDTLYRIAISAKGGSDSTTSNEKLTFLQPPHFRSEMEDDLIDQIASRFGRSALEIENSAVYKKIKGGRLSSSSINLDELDEFDEDGNFVGDGEGEGVNFQDRFQRFIATLMGSSDVYCCPLCYIEADRRLGNQDDDERVEDDESGDEQRGNESHVDRFSFLDDPLTILGNLDSEAFEVAATFCFRLLSGLKKHLKVVHGVNLSDIAGNDLFKRFQIRAGDGLLQRWLQKNLRRNTVQGDMMRYWNSGENQSFLLLLSQIDRCDQDYSSDFSLSFPNRARKVWSQVSAPYLKQSEDLNDFIADDDEEIEEGDDGGGVPINPHFTPPSINLKDPSDFKSPEEEMIANLQKKNRRYKSTYDDSDDAGGKSSSSSDEDELEILDPKPTVEESEDDEWTKSKSYNSKVKHKSAKAVGAKNNDSEDDVFDDDVEIIEEKPPASKTPTSARKRIMESSSDEESY
jgi:hypothetical protein